MYGDQANSLRELARQSQGDDGGHAPRRIVVAGGCSEVGATSIACGLAATLAEQDVRALIIDAATNAGASELCAVNATVALPDVVADLSQAAAALQPGPGEAYLLPNHAVPEEMQGAPWADVASQVPSVVAEMATGFDTIIIDCGASADALWRPLWEQAENVIIVSTASDESVVGAYSAIKRNMTSNCRDVRVLVNCAETRAAAESVWRRIAASANRFLQVAPAFAGYLPIAAESSGGDALRPTLHTHATARLCLRRIISDLEEARNEARSASAERSA